METTQDLMKEINTYKIVILFRGTLGIHRGTYGSQGENAQKVLVRNKGKENMTSIKQQPWKIMCQNTNRLITENSKEKIIELTEYTDDNGILLMNLTETWLEQKIQHDEIIAGYQVLRCDRRDRVGVGWRYM